MTVYCDTCILIYFFDHAGSWQTQAANRLAKLALAGGSVVLSDLVRLEYRVQPLRIGDSVQLANFDAYCRLPDILYAPITTLVFDRATELRARYNFKLGDSIHLAAAIEAGCDSFLTNDTRLAACAEIPIEVLT